MASHVDHSKHSKHSIIVGITEQSVADVHDLSRARCAEKIITNCAHPEYRPLLQDYLDWAG